MTRILAMALAMTTGCAAATGALSTLGGGKQQPVTVTINNTNAPAPAPQVVVIAPQVESPMIDVSVKPATKSAAKKGAVAGEIVGGVVGYALDGKRGAVVAGLLGAGTGAIAGVVVEETR